MPPTSAKNFAASPAALALGLGDQLTLQLQSQEEDKARKLKASAQNTGLNPAMMGPAALSLFGNNPSIGGFFG